MIDKKKYLTLGEVAERLGINKTTLRHYNREGLIMSERDENNYRYYTEEQLYNFKAILNLRKMGFSIDKIKEIRTHLQNNDYSVIKEEVIQRINECQKQKEELENNIKILEDNTKYVESLKDIVEIDPEYISVDFESKAFIRKHKEIFSIKIINDKKYAVLYIGFKFSDKEAVEILYKRIEENGYKPAGDLSIEVVKPFGKLSAEDSKIKIFKIPINPLTCQSVSGLK